MQDFIKKLSNKQKIILLSVLVVVILIGFFVAYKYFNNSSGDKTANTNDIKTTSDNSKNDVATTDDDAGDDGSTVVDRSKNKKGVVVDVVGEVNSPGVVTLKENARIIDAINAAGGKTDKADLTKINLAFVVEDGTQIYVPRVGEKLDEDTEYVREGPGEGVVSEEVSKDSSSSGESSGSGSGASSSATGSKSSSTKSSGSATSNKKTAKININTADEGKLESLPGIGKAMAQKIIDYRSQNGKFKAIEDLKKVNGIGDIKFNNVKDKITVK